MRKVAVIGNFVKAHKGLTIALVIVALFLKCAFWPVDTFTVQGIVTAKHFSNTSESYMDIESDEFGTIRLAFDTEEITGISICVGFGECRNFRGEAEILNEMISVGDTLKVEVSESKGHIREVLDIIEIHKK